MYSSNVKIFLFKNSEKLNILCLYKKQSNVYDRKTVLWIWPKRHRSTKLVRNRTGTHRLWHSGTKLIDEKK